MECPICKDSVTVLTDHVARSHGNIEASEMSWRSVCPLCHKVFSGIIEADTLAAALGWNYQLENQDTAYQSLLQHIRKAHFANN